MGYGGPDAEATAAGAGRSARGPVRMVREKSIHEGNFVNYEKAEGQADQAGGDAQPSIEMREAIVGVGKRENHRSSDEHHACNRADPENEQVNNRPFRIANCGQDQQRDRCRASEAVDESYDERPHGLIEAEAAEMAVEPTERRLRRRVRMRFGVVLVRMSVNVIAVAVRVRMGCAGNSSDGRKRLRHPLEYAGEVQEAQKDQHQADRKLHREADARGNHPAEEDDSASHDENCERVA
jgi:hypothetical protein